MKSIIIIFVLNAALLLCGCTGINTAESALSQHSSVLVLDPGHGGADGGAVAGDGTKESELNLQVAKKAEAICIFLGIECVLTRSSEELQYPDSASTIREKKLSDQKGRVALINSIPSGVLISIHQNIYPAVEPKGAQALYGAVDGSCRLAEYIVRNTELALGKDSARGSTKISDDIYLMKKAECPAVLLECGFLSNPEELLLLKNEDYQRRLAAIIVSAGAQFISETGNYYG